MTHERARAILDSRPHHTREAVNWCYEQAAERGIPLEVIDWDDKENSAFSADLHYRISRRRLPITSRTGINSASLSTVAYFLPDLFSSTHDAHPKTADHAYTIILRHPGMLEKLEQEMSETYIAQGLQRPPKTMAEMLQAAMDQSQYGQGDPQDVERQVEHWIGWLANAQYQAKRLLASVNQEVIPAKLSLLAVKGARDLGSLIAEKWKLPRHCDQTSIFETDQTAVVRLTESDLQVDIIPAAGEVAGRMPDLIKRVGKKARGRADRALKARSANQPLEEKVHTGRPGAVPSTEVA